MTQKYTWLNRAAYAEDQVDIMLEAIEHTEALTPELKRLIKDRALWHIRVAIRDVTDYHQRMPKTEPTLTLPSIPLSHVRNCKSNSYCAECEDAIRAKELDPQ